LSTFPSATRGEFNKDGVKSQGFFSGFFKKKFSSANMLILIKKNRTLNAFSDLETRLCKGATSRPAATSPTSHSEWQTGIATDAEHLASGACLVLLMAATFVWDKPGNSSTTQPAGTVSSCRERIHLADHRVETHHASGEIMPPR
jgi:hypothetical protein